MTLALILLFILKVLCGFILIFEYLVTDEAWVSAPGQEVENECSQGEQGRGNKHDDSLRRSLCQIVPIECN